MGINGRIAVELSDEGEYGVLYVANGGQPFKLRNVEALCDVGLSDKELGHWIGNKGLGFRSVAFITDVTFRGARHNLS